MIIKKLFAYNMEDISFVYNTGIQFYELPQNLLIDLSGNNKVINSQSYYEYKYGDKVYLDQVYYMSDQGQFLRRQELLQAGYINPMTNEIDYANINYAAMNWLSAQSVLTVNRIDILVGDKRQPAIEQIENHWLPLPYYYSDLSGCSIKPTGWCRMKLRLNEAQSTKKVKAYKVILAFDTTGDPTLGKEIPSFQGERYLDFSLCGISMKELRQVSENQQRHIKDELIPLKAYDFCNPNTQPWLNLYLQEIFHSTDLSVFPVGSKMKYLVYYSYFISYIHALGILPDVRLYNDAGQQSIATNLVLDVGNSRTFGLVAEDPIDTSFSKSSIIKIRDLDTGEEYSEPFDMRLCFKEERFGVDSAQNTFKWPSVVRLGREALRCIYAGEEDLNSHNQYDTSYSSPKRFLWDKEEHKSQWKYISDKDKVVGPTGTVYYEGIMQQFYSDGRFAADPQKMGDKSSYSRSSLMTFCFIEILLQVKQQINSYAFRKNNDNEHLKREVKRVILTCPTAMSREEQKTLRQCMQDASIVLSRYYGKTYNQPYNPLQDLNKVEIIPSVQDLSLTASQLYLRRNWNYDEATCCQMVYLYGELRRYLGNTDEFFEIYGRYRNDDPQPSITIATLDIGAGTTDIMICNYTNNALSIQPTPLFWESFKIAGDDLVKRIIIDVLLDAPQKDYPEASGIITARLMADNVTDVAVRMHHFFDDTQNMGVKEKRMRKEFMIQVLQPIATHLLDMLQRDEEEAILCYDDLFNNNRPAKRLMDFFAAQMGFRFEDLRVRYSPKFLNEIIRRVFETSMRKWAALFHTYKCDIVLLSGRPCSIKQVYNLLRRLYPVAPNRLVSMNSYRVGSWYPGSTDIGHFRDNKSMVAVGALISYLAENGKLHEFKLNTSLLKTSVLPTTDYMGIINPQTGTLLNILTPDEHNVAKEISALPVLIGAKQMDVEGYPSNQLYVLRFNEKYIRNRAIAKAREKAGLPVDIPDGSISPDSIENEIETIKFELRTKAPLTFRFERDYYEDKEKIKIDSVEDNEKYNLSPQYFELSLQTWSEDITNWLDSGVFKLHIGNQTRSKVKN